MAQSLNANFRYQVLDRCFRDKSKVYHHEELIDAIEMDFKERGIFVRRPSKRIIDYDISHLRSGKIGIECPIGWTAELGYHYTDPDFSIYRLSLKSNVIRDLSQALALLKQFTADDSMTAIHNSILTLEHELFIRSQEIPQQIIYLESSSNVSGIKWIGILFDLIDQKKTLLLEYEPFGEDIMLFKLSPYNIFEYNNRWYLFAWDFDNNRIVNLSLDRIISIQNSLLPYFQHPEFSVESYTKNLYGITRHHDSKPEEIIFKASKLQSRYLETKPIHYSQEKIQTNTEFNIYRLYVIINYEIKSRLLSYGSSIEILSPSSLRTYFYKEAASIKSKHRGNPA